MKLNISGNNLQVSLTNGKGEPIYTYQASEIKAELDIAKLVESINEIQQMVFTAIEKALSEPATQVGPGSSDLN